MRDAGLVELHKKPGSLGSSIPGPLIFGVGFALLGYCPGTSVGAIGHGALDALVGCIGIMIGVGIYAAAYPFLRKRVLHIGDFGEKTLIELVHARNSWTVTISVSVIIVIF